MVGIALAPTRTRTPRRREYPRIWLNESTTITNGQLLALNNAIEDLRDTVQTLRDEQGTTNQVMAQHDDAITRFDDRVLACEQTLELAHYVPVAFGRGSQPDPCGLPSPVRSMADDVVDPRMVALNIAISHLIAGALIAQKCGITGDALRDYVRNAADTAELRYQNETR